MVLAIDERDRVVGASIAGTGRSFYVDMELVESPDLVLNWLLMAFLGTFGFASVVRLDDVIYFLGGAGWTALVAILGMASWALHLLYCRHRMRRSVEELLHGA